LQIVYVYLADVSYVSFANKVILNLETTAIIYYKNRIGSRLDPWGTTHHIFL